MPRRSVAASLDPALLKAWFHTITTMRTELANWTARQSKHAAVAYPLITYLICMEENNTFSQYVDTLVDNLHRQLKASNYADVATHTHTSATHTVCDCLLVNYACFNLQTYLLVRKKLFFDGHAGPMLNKICPLAIGMQPTSLEACQLSLQLLA